MTRREVDRHNREAGRRRHRARGRSYEAVFEAGLATRIKRTYGLPETQADLLPIHKSGAKVLLGRDPDDFSADCVACDEGGNLVCEGIGHVKAGD